jgi:protein-S-isoprenylcysteine O-methyltransferase Ste14
MFDLIFTIITFIWLLEFIYQRRFKSSNPDMQHHDSSSATPAEKTSLPAIWLVIILSIASSIVAKQYEIALFSADIKWIGICIYVSGVLLRFWGILTLGVHFSRQVIAHQQMKLASTGPYRNLRHPLYTGIILCCTGISISANTWLGLLTIFILVIPILMYRIHLEESHMRTVIGNSYDTWCKSRWRLIPYLY